MDKSKAIIALDFASLSEARNFLALFKHEDLNLKVGMEMYYAHGQAFVSELIEAGHHVFLDLKLHDIPNTVERAMKQLAKLGVSMVNVHAAGGSDMMKAAKAGLLAGTSQTNTSPLLIAVTQLTSTTERAVKEEQRLAISLEESVITYASLAQSSGLDGVVCSPHEVRSIKNKTGSDFLTVTPGIRLLDSNIQGDDQHRFTSPKQAQELGTDYIVVGRPITQALDPVAAYERVQKEFSTKEID